MQKNIGMMAFGFCNRSDIVHEFERIDEVCPTELSFEHFILDKIPAVGDLFHKYLGLGLVEGLDVAFARTAFLFC